jgi:hypothetical protein
MSILLSERSRSQAHGLGGRPLVERFGPRLDSGARTGCHELGHGGAGVYHPSHDTMSGVPCLGQRPRRGDEQRANLTGRQSWIPLEHQRNDPGDMWRCQRAAGEKVVCPPRRRREHIDTGCGQKTGSDEASRNFEIYSAWRRTLRFFDGLYVDLRAVTGQRASLTHLGYDQRYLENLVRDRGRRPTAWNAAR